MGIVTTVLIMHFNKICQVCNGSKCRHSLKLLVLNVVISSIKLVLPHMNQDYDIPAVRVFLMIVFCSNKNTLKNFWQY